MLTIMIINHNNDDKHGIDNNTDANDNDIIHI